MESSSLVLQLRREERELSARLAAVRQLLDVYAGNEDALEEVRADAMASDGGPYVRRRTGDALEVMLTQHGRPMDYDQAIRGLLAGGCQICKVPRLYYKTLRIVVAQNPARFVDEEGKIGLVVWNRDVSK